MICHSDLDPWLVDLVSEDTMALEGMDSMEAEALDMQAALMEGFQLDPITITTITKPIMATTTLVIEAML
jgi:hypothetical protein